MEHQPEALDVCGPDLRGVSGGGGRAVNFRRDRRGTELLLASSLRANCPRGLQKQSEKAGGADTEHDRVFRWPHLC